MLKEKVGRCSSLMGSTMRVASGLTEKPPKSVIMPARNRHRALGLWWYQNAVPAIEAPKHSSVFKGLRGMFRKDLAFQQCVWGYLTPAITPD